ncbi:MAG: hypothetical protein ACFFD6_07935 [Candidatus Thorarchaeota archaeon]
MSMEDEDDLMDLTGPQAVGLALIIIIASILTLYTFITLSTSLVGWAILILIGAFGLGIVLVLNRRYRIISNL